MNIMDIYFAPSKVFAALKEKPQWVTPFIIVLVVVALTAALTVNFSRDEIMTRQEEAMREQGRSEEEIERAMQFTSGPVIFLGSAISATIFTAVLMLLFALIVNLFVPLFGGESGFKTIFSVICFSSLVVVPSAILKLILIAITKSPYVTTSLALLAPGLAKDTFVYKLFAGFDFFIIWEMILVAFGINITNGIAKKNAYVLVFVIWIISIFVGVGLSSIFGRGM
jgi:hypothetical protein